MTAGFGGETKIIFSVRKNTLTHAIAMMYHSLQS
jgi:hypothetical protein